MGDYQYSDLELKLRAECEQGFVVGPKFNTAYIHVLGAVTSGNEGVFKEMMGRGDSAEDAYQEGMKEFRAFAEGKTGTIFWRVYPEIAESKDFDTKTSEWCFYMRLLISNKGLALVEQMS